MTASGVDERFMRQAIQLARRGRPSPNPHVGAVLVRGTKVIGRGFHRRAGADHAEVAALRDAGGRAKGATMYVTFEPCNHHGRTPPCTDAILAAGVDRVVVGARDPAPHVRGATRKLRRAGVRVDHGVLREDCERLVRTFAIHMQQGRPCVTLKTAVSLDGRSATRRGESRWITGPDARRGAHRLRATHDAVMVGAGTCKHDDPELTVRAVRGRTPLRVLVDSKLRISTRSRLVETAEAGPVLIFHNHRASEAKASRLRQRGVELCPVRRTSNGLSLAAVLRVLAERQITTLMVEGGAQLHGSFLRGGFVDRVACFVAPLLLGDPGARPLAEGPPLQSLAGGLRLAEVETKRLGDDVLIQGWASRWVDAGGDGR